MAEAEPSFSYSADNDRKFRNALKRAQELCDDLTIPLTLISRDFFRSQKAIWKLKGKGQYDDLAPSTKLAKIKAGKSVYPILKWSGLLEESMTDPKSSYAIARIINSKDLELGTKVKYGIYHQFGTKRMPMRKFLFIGPEASRYASDEQMGRLQRWLGILDGHIHAQLRKTIGI